MKVLQVNVVCKGGSTGAIAYSIHAWLKSKGHESVIAYGRGALSDEAGLVRFASPWEVRAHAALTRLSGWEGIFSHAATRRLVKFIKDYRPDVVHLHNLHGYYVNSFKLLTFLKHSGIKTLITLHDEWLYTGKCGYAFECEAWKSACGACPYLKDYPASLFFDNTKAMQALKRKIFDGFDVTIVTPSMWLARRVRESFLRDKRIEVVYNGIDTERFRPQDTGDLRLKYGEGKAVLHITADFSSARKGGGYVLALAGRMPDFVFYIVGNREDILDAPGNVVAIGRTGDAAELAKWYSFADVCLIASKRETFSMVSAEALACGTPVVGFDAGAPAEVAPAGYGMFVPYGDVDALEAAVRAAVGGGMKGIKECAEFGRGRYAVEVMAGGYLGLYG